MAMNRLRSRWSHRSVHPADRLVHMSAVAVTTRARLLGGSRATIKPVMEISHAGRERERGAEEIGRYLGSNLGSAFQFLLPL